MDTEGSIGAFGGAHDNMGHRLTSGFLPTWRFGASLRQCMPRSLRAQFGVALCTMGVLIVAGGATAVYALRTTGAAARQFAEARLGSLQSAQDLLQHSQQIQGGAHRMVAVDSDPEALRIYAQMQEDFKALELMTARLAVGDDVSVLDLHQSSQLFRNSAHLMAQLRESAAPPNAKDAARQQALEQAREQMQTHAQAMVLAARKQSDVVARGYQAAALDVADTSHRSAYFVIAWLAFGLVAAWLIARIVLGQHLLTRLQEVSRYLRLANDGGSTLPSVPVYGDDEIGQMARAVEHCLSERFQLAAARARLEEGQQRLMAIIDNTADSIVLVQDGKVVQVNPAAERMFGFRHAQAVGLPGTTLLPDLDWDVAALPGMAREAHACTSGGQLVPVEVSINTVVSHDGTLLILVVRDATLRKEAEQHLIAARDAAEAARATQARFLANMSHELRTPLNAVLGYAQLLLLQPASLTERQRFAVDTIRTSGDHLLALINDLLDLAKHNAGKLDLCPSQIQLVECLRVTADIIRVKAEEAGLEFMCDIAPDVPATIVADEKRLRQILLNLLSNGVKFTDQGEVMLSVRVVNTGTHKARLRFSVRDTGVGMREDQLEAIFLPFQQVGDAHQRSSGTGLGLAISRQLVRLMGSDLRVSSVPGRGTEFVFDLDVPVIHAASSVANKQEYIVGYQGARKRILVADDLAANRLLLSDMLRPLGFEIEEARDGTEAVNRARSFMPDLILMDLVMPIMSGSQAIRAIRSVEDLRGVPIIAVSANANASAAGLGRDLGADAFVAKPLSRDLVLQAVAKHLALRWTTSPSFEAIDMLHAPAQLEC